MSSFWIASLILHFILLETSLALPDGSPLEACSSMIPNHQGTSAQISPSPYSIRAVRLDESVLVTIEDTTDQRPFRGFLLQAIGKDNRLIEDGKFVPWEHSKTINCGTGRENTLTHRSPDEKRSVNSSWLIPSRLDGDVAVFRATIVQNYITYWIGVESAPLSSSNQPVENPTTATSVIHPTTKLTTTTAPTSLDAAGGFGDLYSGCGSKKGCFGFPRNCAEKRTCEMVLVYQPDPLQKLVHFQLIGALGATNGWIAMALSRNNKMGDDSVTECALVNGNIVVRESWNVAIPRKNNVPLIGSNNITNQKGDYNDGVITCSWSRPQMTSVNGYTFDLSEDQFYIFLATGPLRGDGRLVQHRSRLSSANPVNLTSASLVIGKTSTLVKIHGSLMTVAWIMLVSIGILFPRHYKQVWSKYKLCGAKIWFAVHRCFMLTSVAVIVAAFATIFVDVDGWSDVAPNPHPLLGCIATGLAVIQPLIAACRPKPTSPKRPIFRWLHGMIGTGAQAVALVNMFFAVSLKTSNLPDAFYYVLITFTVFHCMVHLLIHVHTCFMERERERESTTKLHQFQFGDGYDIHANGPGTAFKKFALGLYSLVVAGLTVALVLMIVLN